MIQVGSAAPRRRQATPLSEQTNLNRTMKARAEGEVAANPLGDLSPFSPPCVDFHFTPNLCRLHFRSSRERLRCRSVLRYGSIPSSKTVECCKTIFVPPLTFFQCSVCRLLLSLICVVGCVDISEETKEKTEITMYLWDKSMAKNLTPWLEQQFPEYKFTFVVGYNSMDYYSDLTQRGEPMPDIITCRRFSINDTAHLSNQLLDLSSTDVAGTFYNSYIENNREKDGAIRWLPMCAEVAGFIANLDLFEQHNIPVPTDYQGFVNALAAFEAAGVRGFAGDWGQRLRMFGIDARLRNSIAYEP